MRNWMLLVAMAIPAQACAAGGGLSGTAVESRGKPITGQDQPEASSANDAALAEIISQVRKNEALYRNLEVVLEVSSSSTPQGQAARQLKHGLQIVTQGDLIFFEGREQRPTLSGDLAEVRRVSAYDGQHTRNVEYGNSVNIHVGRHESPYIYPPHCWTLYFSRVNVPLSVFLSGTDALREFSKGHKYCRETGTIYEFPRVECSYEGDDSLNGLKCTKVRCKRWYRSTESPVISVLWLAIERNYLCMQEQNLGHDPDKVATTYETTIESFRELADSIWLPSRINRKSYKLEQGNKSEQPIEGENLLVLEDARLKSDRPTSFFGDIELPADLPTYTVKDWRLVGTGLQLGRPTPDSDRQVKEIIASIRQNEEKYEGLQAEVVESYKKFDPEFVKPGSNFIQHVSSSTVEKSVRRGPKSWYEERESISLADGSVFKTSLTESSDGQWLRSLRSQSTGEGQHQVSVFATLRKVGHAYRDGQSIRPHMIFFRRGHNESLADYLESGWQDRRNNYRLEVDYLGEEPQDGLHCDVLRLTTITRADRASHERNYRAVWLAKEKNYLPVRFEWYEPHWSDRLPTAVGKVDDLREIRPGQWCPFRAVVNSHQKLGAACVGTGHLVINHRTDYALSPSGFAEELAHEQLAGPIVTKGTKVQVWNESDRYLGSYVQANDQTLSISEDTYRELLNEANDREQKKAQQLAVMDALVGKPAPDLPEMQWLNGTPRKWSDFAGEVVIVDFWAEWCGPCVNDLKQLSEFHKSWHEAGTDPGIEILGVHTAGSEAKAVEEAASRHDLKYPICIDAAPTEAGYWGTLYERFGVKAIPTAFVIDQDGKVAAHGRVPEMLLKARNLAHRKKSGS